MLRIEQLGSHWKDFHDSQYLNIVRKSVKKKNQVHNFTLRPIHILIISRSNPLRMRNVSDKIYRENQNTHFMFNNIFPENCAVYFITWGGGDGIAGQARDDNKAHAHCPLDN